MLITGCGSGGGDGGGPVKAQASYVTFADNWQGTLNEATTGSFGEVELTLQQSGANLTGIWNAKFNTGTINAGTITGAVLGNDNIADFTLTGTGGCPISVTVSVQPNEAQGAYTTVSCPVLLAGSVHVYRAGGATPYNPPLPTQPTGVVATAGDGQVTLRWSRVAGASSHNVYWSASAGVTPSTGTQELQVGEPATITGLTSGTPYYFVVTAKNASGEGPASVEVNATPLASATNAPTGVYAQAASEQVTVTWPSVSGATAYNLYWGTTPGQAYNSGTMVNNVTSGYVLSGLANGTTYFIAVTAINTVGESAPSGEAYATPYESTSYNFDSGSLQGWTPTGSWSVVSSTSHSSSYSVTDSPYGNYSNYASSYLKSPQFDLSGSMEPMLTFWHKYEFENGYDVGRVEISDDYGSSWDTLKSFTGTNSTWSAETISLSSYSGKTVIIRFRLTTDSSGTADGWYLDDIVISR